jgi:putative ABC transport system ATP-binding protein
MDIMLCLSNIGVNINKKNILDNISLNIRQGEKIKIYGSSGSGKSTLLKCILLFESAATGTVNYNNNIINEQNVADFRLNFSYISQKLPYFYETVEKFVFLPLNFKNNNSLIITNEHVKQYFDRFSLDIDLLKKEYNSLSDGEKQRVCIVQALLLNRKFMLLDEITSNLDRKNKEKVVEVICEDTGRTVINVSHDNCWDDMCTRKILLENGKIAEDI